MALPTLLLVLVATPDAGAVASWRVILSSSTGTDVGNGEIISTSDTSTVITPGEVRRSTVQTNKGKRSSKEEKPRPLAPEVRDAITALLPRLPRENASFSISPYVNDEGWESSRIVLVREGKTVVFQLVQGSRVPPVPPEVDELEKLVGRALKE